MRSILILFLVSIFYIGSVFGVTQGKKFRLDSDYDSNLPIISYVAFTIRNEKRFPLWNPYVSTGISVLGDPLSGVTYLPYLLPMLVFGVPRGWWVVIWLHAFMAGACMWVWLRELLGKKSSLPLWGGMLYMGAGSFAARVAAGHIEKALSYPWYPVFLMLILKKEQTGRYALLIGAVMGIVFLTGDMYGLLFLGIWYGVIGMISPTSSRWPGLRGVKGIGMVIGAFAVVSAMKLVPFLRGVAPVISRYSTFDPARGSLHAFFSWIPFVVPWGASFYERPFFQHVFGFWYNWYEYYAFIGLPIVFLLLLPKIIKRREAQLLLLLLVVGFSYVARGYWYSLWYGLGELLRWFRAPQRMYGALTSVVVALVVLCAKQFKHPLKYVFLWSMLLVTFVVNGYQMTQGFEKPRWDEEAVVRELRARDSGDITVATFACCMQTFLVRERIRVINYYYGWLPKGAPRFTTLDGKAFSLDAFEWEKPAYIIAPQSMEFGKYGYGVWFNKGEIVVWRLSNLAKIYEKT